MTLQELKQSLELVDDNLADKVQRQMQQFVAHPTIQGRIDLIKNTIDYVGIFHPLVKSVRESSLHVLDIVSTPELDQLLRFL